MWLAVFAPVISRTLATSAAAGDWCPVHGVMADIHSDGHSPDDPTAPLNHLDKCGYCVLFGHSPLLGGAIVLWLGAAPLKAVAPPLRAVPVFHRPLPLSTHPRGPPLLG